MVLNSANYFTLEALNNHLTGDPPTLIGSLVVMGGALFIPPGDCGWTDYQMVRLAV